MMTNEQMREHLNIVNAELERIKQMAAANKNDKTMLSQILNPIEALEKHYKLPFDLYPYQMENLEFYTNNRKTGMFWEPGTGKTAQAVASALIWLGEREYDKVVVIMPPILIDQWRVFLESVEGVEPEDILMYRGTVKQREKLKLGKNKFTLVSSAIFRIENDKFNAAFDSNTYVIRDEAHDIKNMQTQNFKKFKAFAADKAVNLLTGTPLSDPEDAYAYMSLLAPEIYRTKSRFMNIHAGRRDFFNKVLEWNDLDMLRDNMNMVSTRVLFKDVHDIKEVFTPIPYTLNKKHWELYRQVAEDELLRIDDSKIDATSTQALYHTLQQIICNFEYFGNGKSTCFDVIEQVLDEINGRKLVIFGYYRRTNEALLEHLKKYNAVAAYGAQTPVQNRTAAETFQKDPDCRIMIVQPSSGGVGLDGLQTVCHDGLFLEFPSMREFKQAYARLHRTGQKNVVNIRIAYALETLQVTQFANLMHKDSVVNKVVRSKEDLRKAIFGEKLDAKKS